MLGSTEGDIYVEEGSLQHFCLHGACVPQGRFCTPSTTTTTTTTTPRPPPVQDIVEDVSDQQPRLTEKGWKHLIDSLSAEVYRQNEVIQGYEENVEADRKVIERLNDTIANQELAMSDLRAMNTRQENQLIRLGIVNHLFDVHFQEDRGYLFGNVTLALEGQRTTSDTVATLQSQVSDLQGQVNDQNEQMGHLQTQMEVMKRDHRRDMERLENRLEEVDLVLQVKTYYKRHEKDIIAYGLIAVGFVAAFVVIGILKLIVKCCEE